MKMAFGWKVMATSAALSLGLALPVLAQSDNGAPASESMKAAGESMENAGSDTASAAKHAYQGTATAVRDTKITAKIKTALHEDNATEGSEIHVSTSAGIVTLKGAVGSPDIAVRAEQVAHSTEGVKEVDNQLKVSRATMPD